MKKLIILFCFFASSLLASEMKELNSLDELQKDKNIFIVFSTTYCPWCSRQKRVLEEIDVIRDNLQLVYVDDTSRLSKELISKYALSVKYYPTTYIAQKDEDGLVILYEFRGYQSKSNILKVLDDEDSF